MLTIIKTHKEIGGLGFGDENGVWGSVNYDYFTILNLNIHKEP